MYMLRSNRLDQPPWGAAGRGAVSFDGQFAQAPAAVPAVRPLPRVIAWRFKNSGQTDPSNCCRICSSGPIPLGVGIALGGQPRARNGMELQFTLSDHRAGIQYEITRTKRSTTWERVGGIWRRLHSQPMGTSDDRQDRDECLSPRNNRLFVIDLPGWPVALPAAAGTRFSATPVGQMPVESHADATDVVRRLSMAEWPMARSIAEGIPWTPLQLPPQRSGAARRFIFWHNIVWLTRDGLHRWVIDRARSRIGLGSLSATVVNSPP